jgi:hypothetical protein
MTLEKTAPGSFSGQSKRMTGSSNKVDIESMPPTMYLRGGNQPMNRSLFPIIAAIVTLATMPMDAPAA